MQSASDFVLEHPVSRTPKVFSLASTTHLQCYSTLCLQPFQILCCCLLLNPQHKALSACWNSISKPCCYIQAIKAPHTSWLGSRSEHLVLCFHWQFCFLLCFPSSLSWLHNDRTVFLIWFTQLNYTESCTQNSPFQEPILYINLSSHFYPLFNIPILLPGHIIVTAQSLALLFASCMRSWWSGRWSSLYCCTYCRRAGWELYLNIKCKRSSSHWNQKNTWIWK